MTEQTDSKRIDLKSTQVAAGSLASVTSAVAASQLGVGGTLLGAGVGSVVGTVAGAVYEHYLDQTHQRVRSAVVPRRSGGSESPPDEPTLTPSVDTQAADPDTEPSLLATAALASSPEPPATPTVESQSTWTWLRSRRLALVLSAAAGLGIALLALTGFEAVTGQPVSSGVANSGGTSIGHVFGGNSAGDTETDPSSTPSPEASTGEDPASTPSASSSATPSPQPSTSSTSPTAQPVPDPTAPNAG